MSDFDEDEFTLSDLKKVAPKKPEVTEDSLMPFGKFKGATIGSVPASYLLWWADTGPDHHLELLQYILENRRELLDEADDQRYSGDYYS